MTGGGSGIGAATACALATAGWSVAVIGRRREPLDAVCAAASGDLLAHVADVSIEASVIAAFDAVIARFGRIDLLFNNAGTMMRPTAIGAVSLDAWRALLDVNVTGAFLCAREAFRRMAAQDPQGGRIINNGSISAHVPRPLAVGYTVSKHAITGLTRALSLEGRGSNIACGQIDIGNAVSAMSASLAAGAMQADGAIRPEPMMDVDNVARSVLHMASLPLDTNVQFMTVMASAMPYIGRG